MMDFLNSTESMFNYDESFSNSSVDSYNLTSSNLNNLTTNVARHNCTGADEMSMRTYYKVSWWFTGIVQVVMTERSWV